MKNIQKVLNNIGFIVAGITAIVYIATLVVMIEGIYFGGKQGGIDILLFPLVNAIIGITIMGSLRSQGVIFAKMIPENIDVLKEYTELTMNEEQDDLEDIVDKNYSIEKYMAIQYIKDIFIKGIGIVILITGITYIAIAGIGDWSMMLNGIANLLMFVSSGITKMTKSYNYYNEKTIPYMKIKIRRIQNDKRTKTIEQRPNRISEE